MEKMANKKEKDGKKKDGDDDDGSKLYHYNIALLAFEAALLTRLSTRSLYNVNQGPFSPQKIVIGRESYLCPRFFKCIKKLSTVFSGPGVYSFPGQS